MNNDDLQIIFNDEYCYEDWVESFVKEALDHTRVWPIELYVEEIDEDFIYLRAKEKSERSGAVIENKYRIRYMEDAESWYNPLFFYILYFEDGCHREIYDYGVYELVRYDNIIKWIRVQRVIQ